MNSSQHQNPILIAHSSDELYGSDRMILMLIDALNDVENLVLVLPDDPVNTTPSLSTEALAKGVHVQHIALPILRRRMMNLKGLKRLGRQTFSTFRAMRQIRPKEVWCGTSAALIVAPIARILRVKKVFLYQQEVWPKASKPFLSFLALFCKEIISVSMFASDSIPRCINRRKHVLYNSVLPPKVYLKRPNGDKPVFLVASRHTPGKGYKTLLDAWKKANEPGTLLIAGSVPALGTGIDLVEIIEEHKIEKSVKVLGEIADLDPVFQIVNFVIVPSDLPEGFGLIAAESLARGIPVICSNAGGLTEVVVPNESGFIFTAGNSEELASILRNSTVEASIRMSGAAKARYESTFSLNKFKKDLSSWRNNVLKDD